MPTGRTAIIACSALIIANSAYGQSSERPKAGENGHVLFSAIPDNHIVRVTTNLQVPSKPEPAGTLFVWPGLQPDRSGTKFLPINNGVLQSVLTWGNSCEAHEIQNQPKAYSTWWISGQYVNTFGHHRSYTGCYSGPIMRVEPGDTLAIDMELVGSKWIQTIRKPRSNGPISFEIDMKGQSQHHAHFDIEVGKKDGGPYVEDVVFTDTRLVFAKPHHSNCRPQEKGPEDEVDTTMPQNGGKECYFKKITLKSKTRPTVADHSCETLKSAKSSRGQVKTTITFENARGLPMKLYWIDYNGARKKGVMIENGGKIARQTYLTHPWLVTDFNDACIGIYLPTNPASKHVIR